MKRDEVAMGGRIGYQYAVMYYLRSPKCNIPFAPKPTGPITRQNGISNGRNEKL